MPVVRGRKVPCGFHGGDSSQEQPSHFREQRSYEQQLVHACTPQQGCPESVSMEHGTSTGNSDWEAHALVC